MKENHLETGVTLVVGGTGKTGRRVAGRLAARGLPVRIGARSGKPPFDWEDQDTWAPALRGTTSVYLTYFPDLAAPGSTTAIAAFADLAEAAGVRRLALLSGRGEPEAKACEEIVRSHPYDTTVVRASMFSQNFSEHFLRDPILSGVVAFPAGQVAEPFIDADDIADVAVAALTEDGHAGEVYEVTGPRLLTFAEAVGEIARAAGRSVEYVPVTPAEYQAALVSQGVLPEPVAAMLADLFTAIFDGRNERVADGVPRALGREPRDFTAYARTAAAAGAWNGA